MLIAVFFICTGLVALWLFERFAERSDQQRHPAPGRLIAVNCHRLHLVEQGASGPVVILESGLAASSLSWVLTPPLMASFCRVASYDRAGLGRSSDSAAPLSLSAILSDLHAIVQLVSPAEPVILVGHSFGGLIVQAFAHLYPDRVSALLLLDPVSLATYAQPSDFHHRRIRLAVSLSKRGAFLARFAVVRGALLLLRRQNRRLPLLIGRLTSGKANKTLHRLAREIEKLPIETHRPICAYWSRPHAFRIMAEYLNLLPGATAEAITMPVPKHIPMIILSAADATADDLVERGKWLQNRPYSRHTQVPGTGHWLQLDCPELVAQAVHDLIDATA